MLGVLSGLFDDPMGTLISLLYMLPALIISLTVHEWGHAFAAHLCGDDTAKHMGRMTFNPIAHLDPLGLVCLLVAGFGWAKPVPVNPNNFRKYRRDDVIVSLAGIAMNFVLLLLASLTLVLGFRFGLYDNTAFVTILYYFIAYNAALMVFNLLPFFPLDGYHVFEIALGRVLPWKFFMTMRKYGQWILIAFLVLTRVTGINPIGGFVSFVVGLVTEIAFIAII